MTIPVTALKACASTFAERMPQKGMTELRIAA
jgi:hypothetical protein